MQASESGYEETPVDAIVDESKAIEVIWPLMRRASEWYRVRTEKRRFSLFIGHACNYFSVETFTNCKRMLCRFPMDRSRHRILPILKIRVPAIRNGVTNSMVLTISNNITGSLFEVGSEELIIQDWKEGAVCRRLATAGNKGVPALYNIHFLWLRYLVYIAHLYPKGHKKLGARCANISPGVIDWREERGNATRWAYGSHFRTSRTLWADDWSRRKQVDTVADL